MGLIGSSRSLGLVICTRCVKFKVKLCRAGVADSARARCISDSSIKSPSDLTQSQECHDFQVPKIVSDGQLLELVGKYFRKLKILGKLKRLLLAVYHGEWGRETFQCRETPERA